MACGRSLSPASFHGYGLKSDCLKALLCLHVNNVKIDDELGFNFSKKYSWNTWKNINVANYTEPPKCNIKHVSLWLLCFVDSLEPVLVSILNSMAYFLFMLWSHFEVHVSLYTVRMCVSFKARLSAEDSWITHNDIARWTWSDNKERRTRIEGNRTW